MWGRVSNQPQWQGFVDCETYYAAYLRPASAHTLVQHNGPWVGDAARQVELINGLAAGRAASLVWAPPGCGKSRFALEVARRIEKEGDRWQVVFVRHDESTVRAELPELTRLKRIVFVVDDAHDCPDLVALLAAACAAAPSDAPLHLLCLTRPTGRASVSRALQSTFPIGTVQEIDLGRPPAPLVRTLIDQLLAKSSPLHRDTIGRFVRQSFFLAVMICNILGRAGKLPQSFQRQDLRERASREPLKEATEGVCGIEAATRALGVYAASTPVDRSRSDIRDLAIQLSGLPEAKLDLLMERVLTAGLFQEDGHRLLRTVPDLLGDLILEEACLDAQGKPTAYSKQLLTRLFETDPAATARNCADLGQLFGSDSQTDLLNAWVLERARTESADSRRGVLKLLQACQSLAASRPDTVLQVAGILEKRGILRRAPAARELAGADSIEMSVLAALLHASEVQPDIVPTALQLGRDLYAAARGDDQSQSRVLEALQDECRFERGRGLPHARAVVNALRAWVSESDTGAAVLAATLSAQFLALDVVVAEGGGSISRARLDPNREVWEVRDVATDTLVRAVTRPESVVQYVALAVLEGYAHTEVGFDQAWGPQLTRELETLAKAVAAVPAATDKLPVWAVAELRGWHWWMHGTPALHAAGKAILTSIQTTDAYQLWKALHSQQLPATSVVPDDAKIPAASRVEHFQSFAAPRESGSTEHVRQLFDDLDVRNSDNDSWRALWRTASDQVPSMPLERHAGAVIGEFARRHPDAAWSFVTEADAEGPLFPLLPFLLDELGKHDRVRRSEEAGRVRPHTRLEEAWLRALGTPQELNEGERTLLARALQSPDLSTIHYSARALLNSDEQSPVEVFNAVITAIERKPADDVLWGMVLDRFARWGGDLLSSHSEPFTDSITQVGNRLITLMQTHSSHLRWGFQSHTRQLDTVFAVLAAVSPEALQAWVQQFWGRSRNTGSGWNDESPLNVSRLKSAVLRIRESTAGAHWIDTFGHWIKGPRPLGEIGARLLADLCRLGDPRVAKLAGEIAASPADAAVESFAEFVGYHGSKLDFATQSLVLLEAWSSHPAMYAPIEDAVIRGLVYRSGGRPGGQPWPAQVRALEAIEARQNTPVTSALFSASLTRAERELKEAMSATSAADEASD